MGILSVRNFINSAQHIKLQEFLIKQTAVTVLLWAANPFITTMIIAASHNAFMIKATTISNIERSKESSLGNVIKMKQKNVINTFTCFLSLDRFCK